MWLNTWNHLCEVFIVMSFLLLIFVCQLLITVLSFNFFDFFCVCQLLYILHNFYFIPFCLLFIRELLLSLIFLSIVFLCVCIIIKHTALSLVHWTTNIFPGVLCANYWILYIKFIPFRLLFIKKIPWSANRHEAIAMQRYMHQHSKTTA